MTKRELQRYLLQSTLEQTLPLWLDAISGGEYQVAEKLLAERNLLRQQLVKLLREEVEAGR